MLLRADDGLEGVLTGKESWEGSVLTGQVRDAEAKTRVCCLGWRRKELIQLNICPVRHWRGMFSNEKEETSTQKRRARGIVSRSLLGRKVDSGWRCLLAGPSILNPGRCVRATTHLSSPSQLPKSRAPKTAQYGEIISILAQERRGGLFFVTLSLGNQI